MNLTDILLRAVPDFTAARQAKSGYREYPLDAEGSRNYEPLVDIAEYGIAGQSYYSRPNSVSEDPLPGVEPTIWLRKSVAERLADINYKLQLSAAAAKIFGGKVELYVDEGLRSRKVQEYLYNEAFPALLRAQHPEIAEEELLARRDELIAQLPKEHSNLGPWPHATGAAVDLKLRYAREDLGFVLHSEVPMTAKGVHSNDAAAPDYLEHKAQLTKEEQAIQKHRRTFYWIMRGALIGDDSGFVVNPTEWWHWSYGDQMWAKLTNAPQAFFSFAPEN